MGKSRRIKEGTSMPHYLGYTAVPEPTEEGGLVETSPAIPDLATRERRSTKPAPRRRTA